MTEKTYLKLQGALSRVKFEARQSWLSAWETFPGARPNLDVATYYAQQLQDLNDAQLELETLYFGEGKARQLQEHGL